MKLRRSIAIYPKGNDKKTHLGGFEFEEERDELRNAARGHPPIREG